MGWFADKYGKNTRPKMSIDTYDTLLTKFGEKAANDTLCDVQDGKIKESTLIKYLGEEKRKKIVFDKERKIK